MSAFADIATVTEWFCYNEAGELTCDGVVISDVISRTCTPLYVYSANGIVSNLQRYHNALSGMDYRICYAVKSSSNLSLLSLIHKSGGSTADARIGMDVVSIGEFIRCQRAKIPTDKIVFSGVGKTDDEMAAALQHGLFSFNIESVGELYALHKVATLAGCRAPIALRFNPDVDCHSHPYISTGLATSKFGLTRDEIIDVAAAIRGGKMALSLNGLSVHIGSQLTDLQPLQQAFEQLKDLMKTVNETIPTPLTFLDVGGGLCVNYEPHNQTPRPTIEEYCALVRKYFADSGVKVLLEPGRSIVADTGILATRILYRKPRSAVNDFLITDCGMNDLMRPALYDSYHHIIPIKRQDDDHQTTDFTVVGPVCESSCKLAADRPLPKRLSADEYLAVLSAGAYGHSMSSNYNTRPQAAEILIQNGRWKVIRRRQNINDILQCEILTD